MKRGKNKMDGTSNPPSTMLCAISRKRKRGCFFSIALIFGVATALIASAVITIEGVHAIFGQRENEFDGLEANELMLSYECFYFNPYIDYDINLYMEEIEEDSYGRRLYCYYAVGFEYLHDALTDQYKTKPWTWSKVYSIVQKKSKNEVYFYRTESVAFPVDPETEMESIEELKKKNDWGKPLDLKKVAKITYDPEERIYPPEIDQDIVQKALYNYLNQEWDKAYVGAIYDEEQRPVYIAREARENPEDGAVTFGNTYAFMLNEQNEVEACVEIEGELNTWIEQMEKLRKTRDGSPSSTDFN